MKKIIIFDTTLRDGEQSAGVSLNIHEKLQIAHQLARLGVDVIEAGFPVASQGDFDAVRAVAEEVRGVTVAGLARPSSRLINHASTSFLPPPRFTASTSSKRLKKRYSVRPRSLSPWPGALSQT